MGLHLGWIPNEPGLRAREYDEAAPNEPEPDPAKVAALRAAQHARGMWARLLIVTGLFALVLFGLIAVATHARWAWPAAGLLAVLCWLPVVLLGLRRRRAETRLRVETEHRFRAHAAELVVYEQGKQQWAESEVDRIAAAPRWLQVAAHEDMSRLDVFGGTAFGRQNMVTGLGLELLGQRAVIVLDLSQDRVADGLLAAAFRTGISVADYEMPRDLAATPLLAGLGADEIASLVVEVVHADDVSATAAGRATDLMILRKVIGVLDSDAGDSDAGDGDVTIGRLHAALNLLLTDGTTDPTGRLSEGERAGLRGLFGDGLRHQVAGNLVRLAAVVEPLSEVGGDAESRPPARLTCLSLADGPRDVAADLTAALVVQWVTRAVSAGADPAANGSPPAVILAGADEQSTRHLARLTSVCERHDIPLVRAFSRLTEESARHLDTRHTAFMRLATRPEAVRAAEHIGLERRFVAGKFAHRRGVNRSRTRTTSESFTHTTGRTEGEAVTHTAGTTKGTAYSEREVPRQNQQVNVHVEDHRREEPRGGSGSSGSRQEPEPRSRESSRPSSGDGAGSAGRDKPESKSGSFWGGNSSSGSRSSGSRGGGNSGSGGGASSLWGGRGGSAGGASRGGAVHVSSNSSSGGKPQVDIMRTNTRFSMQHESEAKTKSWSTSEEDSHTQTTALSRTDGVSVGDEISYELVYDHKVQPETLMALPEDQMLAPHIVESASKPELKARKAQLGKTQPDSKMVALVIDPEVVGTEAVAPVHPSEIPAFEPPAPAISSHVPDYENRGLTANSRGDAPYPPERA